MGGLDRVFRGRRGSQQRPAAAVVGGLWKNGEQGWRYDDFDLKSMYQDAAGSIPVYAPGQGQVDPPVGLQLDKRLGLSMGPELIANGDFSAGLAGWAAGAGVTDAGGSAQFTGVGSGVGLTQTATAPYVAGGWYAVLCTISDYVTGSVLAVRLGGGGSFYSVTSGNGVKTLIIQAGGGSTSAVFLASNSNGATFKVDNVSVRALPGNHRYQTSTPSRPVLSARYNSCYATEDPTQPNWVKTGVVVTRNAALAPNGTNTAALLTQDFSGYITCVESVVAPGTHKTLTIHLKPGSTGWARVSLANMASGANGAGVWVNLTTGAIGNTHVGGSGYAVVDQPVGTLLPDGWVRVTLTVSGLAESAKLVLVATSSNGVSTAPAGATLLVWGIDIRSSSDGVGLPPYQRVLDAATYDTVGFPPRLKWDGVDDWMQTAPIDFSGTDKVTLAAAVRKVSDASSGTVAELSGDANVNNGSFNLLAPVQADRAYRMGSKGTTLATSGPFLTAYPGPHTAVLVGYGCISDGSVHIRVNRTPFRTTSAQGAGNFGAYVAYFGRRGGTILPFNGFEYGNVCVGRELSVAETNALEKYLNAIARAY